MSEVRVVSWKVRALVLVALAGLSAAAVTSKLSWGYWTSPPPAHHSAALLDRLEGFSCTQWELGGQEALDRAANAASFASGETPFGRLAAALRARGLRAAGPVTEPASLAAQVARSLEASGLLFRPSARASDSEVSLWGCLATGWAESGEPLVVAALSGPELGEDRYPYYESVLRVGDRGFLELLRAVRYRYDVAGLEGLAHWFAASVTWAVGLGLWALSIFRRRS